ncbi:hypothetical protein ACHHYP_14137 [Achlya hypogyna]|uniref:DUF3293 domain-containing protein n=1 Tax=Achlya hypogyna TaxID=1202772 RepID=A0A1V9YDR7_ACHHY|nr:hypothetical protein ACHHYP_14137 [Achlya hypogyna]
MESSLHDAWAASYDAWVDVPGQSGVIYNRPGALEEGSEPYPASVLASHLFAVMAWNPMGLLASAEENDRAHEKLTAAVNAWVPPPGGWVAPFFGFSVEWREPGFVLACPRDDAAGVAATRAFVHAQATAFSQGAIYEYTPIDGSNCALLRKTTHVLMSADVDATVFLVQTPRPDTPLAAPDARHALN